MAEDKKGFILYADMITTIVKMAKTKEGKEQVCDLFMTILEYVNDKNPVPSDPMVEIVFEPIKQQLKRDLKSWEKKKKGYSKAGKASAEARKHKGSATNVDKRSTTLNDVDKRSTISTVTVNDSVTVSVNDSVSVKKEPTRANLIEVYFTDLPNSTYFEEACRDLQIGKDVLLAFLPEFKTKKRTNYKDQADMADHLKFLYLKKQTLSKPDQSVILKNPFPKRP